MKDVTGQLKGRERKETERKKCSRQLIAPIPAPGPCG
jgi:hypothetical protein